MAYSIFPLPCNNCCLFRPMAVVTVTGTGSPGCTNPARLQVEDTESVPDSPRNIWARQMHEPFCAVCSHRNCGEDSIEMGVPVIFEGIQDILDMNACFRFSVNAQDTLKEECVRVFPQAYKLQKSPEIAAYGNITPVLIYGPQPGIEDTESKD